MKDEDKKAYMPMTEKLGVLLVDVPEPKDWKYSYIEFNYYKNNFSIECTDAESVVSAYAYECTEEEAKKYPQFRWVALEEICSLKPLDVVELLREEIDCNNISFEVVSLLTGISVRRVERIYRNDLPKEDEMVSILEWVEEADEKIC